MDRAEARMDRFEKSLDGIRKLVQTGMKLMVQIQRAERENKQAIQELTVAQKETDRTLKRFIRSFGGGHNGHERA